MSIQNTAIKAPFRPDACSVCVFQLKFKQTEIKGTIHTSRVRRVRQAGNLSGNKLVKRNATTAVSMQHMQRTHVCVLKGP